MSDGFRTNQPTDVGRAQCEVHCSRSAFIPSLQIRIHSERLCAGLEIQAEFPPLHTCFAGSSSFFDFQIHTLLHSHINSSVALTAVLTIVKSNANQPSQHGDHQCQLGFGARKQPNLIFRITVAGESFTLARPANGRKYSVTFASTPFTPSDQVSLQCAHIKFEPMLVAVPAKYSILALPELVTFNDPTFSDCSLMPNDSSTAIHVSRAILARASPFFITMFKGDWADSVKADEPIQFG
ncbi:hypothetical protein BCR44DRAFT_1222555 [Catenaria anguillulae PL171]|uniref:BTB domain-containing protein n=1 Tax=Catenaria anguillulae PL171 TaxID=765915 RepID=A0A1Y2HEE2_9FUNG|nr:hypothetical protein BCR44DRAFT_1222555 [Catenaria anguillulae PL171]